MIESALLSEPRVITPAPRAILKRARSVGGSVGDHALPVDLVSAKHQLRGLASTLAARPEVTLDGDHLTLETVADVARKGHKVSVAPEAWRAIRAGHAVVLDAAAKDMPVYGLTRGVGWNKDKPVFELANGRRVVSEELLATSREFNKNSLLAHTAGIGEPMSREDVRAGMVVRLNMLLKGNAGVSPAVARAYANFLNHDITPIVPSRGTVGQADILMAAHIGRAMMGQGNVMYRGREMPAEEALHDVGLTPLQPVGKDFLSILSTNALTMGQASLALKDTEHFVDNHVPVFGLMLQGMNGNVAPFSEAAAKLLPHKHSVAAATRIRETLRGSSLWETSSTRAMQDPLSSRVMGSVLGDVLRSAKRTRKDIHTQINGADDNPAVTTLQSHDLRSGSQMRVYAVDGDAAIVPTANFSAHTVVSSLQTLLHSLASLSSATTEQIVRLNNPEITGLSRFLAADGNANGHAFGALEKFPASLQAENDGLRHLSGVNTAMAGGREDVSTASGTAVSNLRKMTENLEYMDSVALLHAAQAVDLRADMKLSEPTQKLYDAYRNVVPFAEVDRAYDADFAAGHRLLHHRSE